MVFLWKGKRTFAPCPHAFAFSPATLQTPSLAACRDSCLSHDDAGQKSRDSRAFGRRDEKLYSGCVKAINFSDPFTLVLLGIGGTAAVAFLGWLGNRLLKRLSPLHITIEEANARYLTSGLRLPRVGEQALGGMVPGNVPSAPQDALQLAVFVRLGLRNRGPAQKTLASAELLIGYHDGRSVVRPAQDRNGMRFTKCDVAADGGYEPVELYFIFGQDDYRKGGYDYSNGATYLLTVRPSLGGATRFELQVQPPAKADKPTIVNWKQLRWGWQHPKLARSAGQYPRPVQEG